MNPEFIVVHNTYNDASARSEVAYMINNNNQTSYHYAIDDKEIIQAIPENRNAWHAGDGNGSGNRKGIGIEICYSKSGGSKFIAAEKLAAKFIAFKLNEKGWGIDKVKKHQDFSGKYCPHRTLDMGWQRFLNMVKDELDKLKTPVHPINTNIVKASYKGRQFNFDGFMKDNTNYVQIRQVLEALGYRVVWDNASKTVLIYDK